MMTERQKLRALKANLRKFEKAKTEFNISISMAIKSTKIAIKRLELKHG